MTADGKHRCLELAREANLDRRGSATGAQRTGPARDASHYRVIGWPDNRPIVMQERVGNTVQSAGRLVVVGEDGLAADVARGRDERRPETGKQQLV
jgi:hypothetical protein